MNNSLHSLFLFISFMLFVQSCDKGLISEELLTNEMRAQNPYNVSDEFTLIDEMGENYIYEVKTRKCTIHEMPAGSTSSGYYLVEEEKTSISSINTEEIYQIKFETDGRYRRLRIRILFKDKGFGFEFKTPMTHENTHYIDSINIQDHWYHDIFINEIEKVDNRAYKLYYSTDYGIVKVDFSDGSYLELAGN